MSSKGNLAIAAMSVLALGALSACSGGSGGETSESCDDNGTGPVQVGVVLPLTGDSALLGGDAKAGLDLAIAQANQKGGFFGERKIELLYEDDKGTPQGGVTGVQKLMGQGVQSIVAGLNSSVAIAEVSITKDQILHFQPAAQSDEITEDGGKYLFQMNNTINQNAVEFDKYIVNTIKPESIGYLGENSAFNDGLLDNLKRDLGAANIDIASEASYEADTTDFSGFLNKAKAADAKTLFVADAYPSRQATLLKQARQIGGFDKIIIATGTVTPATVKAAGDAIEGVTTAQVYVDSIDTTENKEFVKAFQNETGSVPGATSEIAYEAGTILVDAVNDAGSLCDYDAIANTMLNTKFDTPRGPVSYDEKGRPQAENFYVLTVKDGKIEMKDVIS